MLCNVCQQQYLLLSLRSTHDRRFDNVHGSDIYGNPNTEIPEEVLESITRNGVRIDSGPPLITCLSEGACCFF